ncbi:hypothetical protein GGR52DRAFT_548400 [Hypoxylon sp. FL1284]|nr:hypothetical protein GGR52DRAFT_548400 [Hypoxylon sp. FL1284]
MPLLLPFAPPSTFRLGLRALVGNSGKLLTCSATRSLSTRPLASQLCSQYSNRRTVYPTDITRDRRSQIAAPRIFARTLSRFRATTEYISLPDSYEDLAGLPFRKEDLNQREVNGIFGAHLSAEHANKLLRILHGRRVAGTLKDPDLQVNTAQYSKSDIQKALKYLREHIPVDEVINAGLRAEDELKYIESQGQGQGDEAAEQQSEQNGQHDAPSDAAEEWIEAPTGRLPKAPKSDSPYGEGSFDRIRAQNIAKREAEEQRLEEEQKKREEEEALGNIGTLQTEQAKPKALSPRMQMWRDRATSDLQEPPKMKAWERLLPSFAMTVLVLGICAALATMYTPPRRAARLWADIPPAAATCLGLIGLNLTVWVFWKIPACWHVFNRYLLVIAATPRPAQLICAMFSHQTFSHVAMNMVVLWFFGVRLHDEIGRGNFLAIYFASGVLGFMGSLAHLVLFRGLQYTTLGASGAVYGITAAFFWLHKYDEFKIFGYPPDPMSGPQGLAFIGLILGMHFIPFVSTKVHNIDIPSHIAGMAAGVIGADLIKKHMDAKKRIRAEKLKTIYDMGQSPNR